MTMAMGLNSGLGKLLALFTLQVLCCVALADVASTPDSASVTDQLTTPDNKKHHHHKHAQGLAKLGIDQAYFTVVSSVDINISVYAQTDACVKCSSKQVLDVLAQSNGTFVVNYTDFSLQFTLFGSEDTALCSYHKSVPEGSHAFVYVIPSSGDAPIKCNFVDGEAVHIAYLPIIVAFAVYLGLALIWILLKFLYRKNYLYKILFCLETERLVNSDLGTPGASPPDSPASDKEKVTSPAKRRVKSLDAFRGLSLVIMIFVNYRGGSYWFFRHSRWNGLTVADLVFPWFVFIMGTSMAISMRSLMRRATSRPKLALRVCKRTLILFAIGVCMNSMKRGPVDLRYLRIPGVLQRLALSYFGVAILQTAFAKATDTHQYVWWAPIRDILDYWPEWIIQFSFIGVWLGLTFGLNVPGCPKGYLGPGGLADNSSHPSCTGGAAGYIDHQVFGENHIYGHPTCKEIYQTTVAFDPEGILGVLTSIFLCFLGLQAGKILLTYPDWQSRVTRWSIWAIVTGGIAGTLCKFSQNDGWIPVNKNLWSLSYVLALASMAFILLSICYLLIDVLQCWSGAPFFYPGMNSILIYLCHEIFHTFLPVSWKVPNTHASQLAMDLWGTSFWVIVSYVLYRKKIFVTI